MCRIAKALAVEIVRVRPAEALIVMCGAFVCVVRRYRRAQQGFALSSDSQR